MLALMSFTDNGILAKIPGDLIGSFVGQFQYGAGDLMTSTGPMPE
jgi:hypothetical protein